MKRLGRRIEMLDSEQVVSRAPNLEDVVDKVNEIVDYLNKPSVLAEGAFSDGREASTPAVHLRSDVTMLAYQLLAEINQGECFYEKSDFEELMKTIDYLKEKSTYLYIANAKDE